MGVISKGGIRGEGGAGGGGRKGPVVLASTVIKLSDSKISSVGFVLRFVSND